jgi:hypothetical protein
MAPPTPLVQAANNALADPEVRERVRALHAAGAPLVDMVVELGLGASMTAQMQALVASLPADAVEGIRSATLAMLDRGGNAMPLDCDITDAQVEQGVAVAVEIVGDQTPTIRVRQIGT